ncbi:Glycine zipper [Duganella sp. CF402]|uniref:OmpA family protein n=1 Tax=unclassified Duganella TaxID=2636909 RepID=UPI0008C8A485|nr:MULTISPECIES: OmpA family protein [unclassified Duganella]RZT04002.1 outer membrane protein with glycine zipper [Duganella sp. BK701]SEM51836.1 Glycine zipper [Duganella sp. CF402]
MKTSVKFLTVAVCTTLVSACATDPRTGQPSFQETFASKDPCSNNARNIGIAAGAVFGAILANQVKHSDSARIVGALAGATVGGLIGKDMDDRRCALSKIARQYDLKLKTSTVLANGAVVDDASLDKNKNAEAIKKSSVGMVVEVHEQAGSGGHFETNSDQLTEQAQRYFSAIADSYNERLAANNIQDPKAKADYIAQISKRKILLIGHTDDTGSSRLNADLSERRARTVAAYMEKRGIAKDSLYFQGAGEAYPVADNSSEDGRAQNRRVEIVEVADAEGFNRYLADRKPRYEFYRTGEAAAPAAIAQATPAAAPLVAAAPAKTTTAKPANNKPASKPTAPATAPTTTTTAVAAARPAAAAPAAAADGIDFGGAPFTAGGNVDIGQLASAKRATFSLISTAYADEPAIIADCSRDRPRIANSVKTLTDGKVYKTSEHLPGLYGKTWADIVNGHLIVLNKVAVLAGDGAAANLPEFKVYSGYNPSNSASAVPTLTATPAVNTYLGNKGVLYRMFLNGKGGLNCVDVVFANDGAAQAKSGRLLYSRSARLMSADFKPAINK